VSKYLGKEIDESNIHIEFIKLIMASKANQAIIPMQDILGLPQNARMNIPGTTHGNWEWRMLSEQITPSIKDYLFGLTIESKRA